MSERQNTIVFTFDPKSPRISAFDIHEWIYEHLHLPERYIKMVQIDGLRRQMYIKFVDFQRLQDILHLTNGQLEYRHGKGEISLVRIELAATGTKRVRIASLPPEVPDGFVRTALLRYGEVKEIQEESWSKAYRYSVANCIRIVVIALAKHIPTHMTMAGNRVLVSYEGHPMTFYDCNETGHLYQVCPNRRSSWRHGAYGALLFVGRHCGEGNAESISCLRWVRGGGGSKKRRPDKPDHQDAGGAEGSIPLGGETKDTWRNRAVRRNCEGAATVTEVRSELTALCTEVVLDAADSMECGEEVSEEVHAESAIQLLATHPQEDHGASKLERDVEVREGGKHELDSGRAENTPPSQTTQ